MFNRRIYLDYASLTPIDPRVLREMRKFSAPAYANPSSYYKEGVAAKKALIEARKKVASIMHALPAEIFFTGGGTESNNLAIKGAVEALAEKGVAYADMHVLISVIEHSSVRECANYLNEKGVVTDVVPVDSNGVVIIEELKKKIKPNTVIVSIMTVNNEIGTIQPIREIAKTIRHARTKNADSSPFNFQSFKYPIFHTDAAQAPLYIDLNTEKLGVDLLALDGSKMYGPRGVGMLYVKRETPIAPVIHGGGQESGMRSGTENLPGIMGFAKAFELADLLRQSEIERINNLRNEFIEGLRRINKGISFNGTSAPHVLNISIPGIDNEFFVLELDAKGIACSTKSSCLEDEDESYVLKAIGANSKISVRFSFGRFTKKGHIKRALGVIDSILNKTKK
jgi:cysteine desulfurase